ncbi:hypothetical protein PN498_17955 [Oscillatoria sp. CS-180]|uniref:hypothetical protein n=1 Tax=Oscillatoria sp. CS-180 TaxID=3021720 RepID=UPI00232CA3BE|nr:hypothetical protein [Oscillatoria sp. CS-180]MDB9527885.1 hypothetical protein [Oscillatoria sp. CS-180]
MADDDPTDNVLKFEKTLAGANIERIKYFDLPDNYEQLEFSISGNSSFYFGEDETGRTISSIFNDEISTSSWINDFDSDGVQELQIIFSPNDVEDAQSTELVIKPIGQSRNSLLTYTLQGDGIEKQKVFINEEQITSQLALYYEVIGDVFEETSLAKNGLFWSGSDAVTEALRNQFITENRLENLSNKSEISKFVLKHALEGAKHLLSPFESGIEFLDSEEYYASYHDENPLNINVVVVVEEEYFQRDNIVPKRAFAVAKLPNVDAISGVDNQHNGQNAITGRDITKYSARRAANTNIADGEPDSSLTLEQRGFILSDALNFESGGFIIIDFFDGETAKSGTNF